MRLIGALVFAYVLAATLIRLLDWVGPSPAAILAMTALACVLVAWVAKLGILGRDDAS